jgi:hypothetical protein
LAALTITKIITITATITGINNKPFSRHLQALPASYCCLSAIGRVLAA